MRQNNKWVHGVTNLVIPPPPKGIMNAFGIYHLNVILDKNVGEEVVLIIFDPTDFIYDLKAVEPFRFFTSSVAVNTSYGPVYSFIFWVAQPHDESNSFLILDKPVDIAKPNMIEPWARLANQTHLHVLLMNENYDVEGFYEFENGLSFHKAVETIYQLDASRVIDYDKAETEYFNNYPLKDLYEAVKKL